MSMLVSGYKDHEWKPCSCRKSCQKKSRFAEANLFLLALLLFVFFLFLAFFLLVFCHGLFLVLMLIFN